MTNISFLLTFISPGPISNLLINPSIEINMVDIFVRKGYRFKGSGQALSKGALFEQGISFYSAAGIKHPIKHIVLMKIERVLPLVSPVYDTDISENEVIERWSDYWNSIMQGNRQRDAKEKQLKTEPVGP